MRRGKKFKKRCDSFESFLNRHLLAVLALNEKKKKIKSNEHLMKDEAFNTPNSFLASTKKKRLKLKLKTRK